MMMEESEFVFFYDTKNQYWKPSSHYNSNFTANGKLFANVAQFLSYMKVNYDGPTDRRVATCTASSLKCHDWESVHVDAIAARYCAKFTHSPELTGDLMPSYGMGWRVDNANGNISWWGLKPCGRSPDDGPGEDRGVGRQEERIIARVDAGKRVHEPDEPAATRTLLEAA
ncbi:hypothetical protein BDU57DRAFT_533767 [Ampelomyces quisqualis]|uniref:Uncharacterized protein n=1 Tax=Ampelomyces quisqualis TaxID=50730 RepID=A0A6A5Q5V6_AMPQU|nr:hypothetical protein BDU57DRAFT_533767 [Ampelomyces quisqualis]